MAYKQQQFISHSSESWEIQHQDTSSGEASAWFMVHVFSVCPPMGDELGSSVGSFYKNANPVHKGSILMT